MSTPFLTHPTPTELHAHQTANSVGWRGALPLEAYLRRETCLYDQPLTRSGGLQPWILAVPSSSPPPTATTGTSTTSTPPLPPPDRSAVCSCETLRKRALLALAPGPSRPSPTPAPSGPSKAEVRDVTCYGVASVFTLPSHRGKGHASAMFSHLARWMEGQGRGKGGFSVLYSDIGKEFYAKHGWEARESSHLGLAVTGTGSGTEAGGKTGVRVLGDGDLQRLCERDEESLRTRVETLAGRGTSAVAICPDAQTFGWHFARESFVSNELFGRVPEVKGAMTRTARGKDVWCWWTRWWTNEDVKVVKGNVLHILRLVVDDEEYDDSPATEEGVKDQQDSEISVAVAALLAAAGEEAGKWAMESVQIWNPSSTTVAAARRLDSNVQVVHREMDSIASLRWCDAELDVGDTLTWCANEKFAWC
ncbi:DNA polymerase zeta catalytic subunit [Sphaceloma murrayae]|uniref:DNA polymerase zeta catalytic subunit n=1 Tax=Sphaceloma murrayae TaxID=2082308 RepID=A0A2K1QTQ1_9PEZI|nr:DNA polymerase zeta catalytic subunit [Sphaceloma murrayae]